MNIQAKIILWVVVGIVLIWGTFALVARTAENIAEPKGDGTAQIRTVETGGFPTDSSAAQKK